MVKTIMVFKPQTAHLKPMVFMTWQVMSGIGAIVFMVELILRTVSDAVVVGSVTQLTCYRSIAAVIFHPMAHTMLVFVVSGIHRYDPFPRFNYSAME